MSGSVIKTFADERLLASNLGISFFPSYCFGVAVKVNSISCGHTTDFLPR